MPLWSWLTQPGPSSAPPPPPHDKSEKESISGKMSSCSRLTGRALPPGEQAVKDLSELIEDGEFYVAQQRYKCISFRYIFAGRYSETLEILHSGACLQLKYGKVSSGAELGVLFVDTLVKGKFPCDDYYLGRVREIYENFYLGFYDMAAECVECCTRFLKAAIEWSAEFGSSGSESPILHDMLAEYIYSLTPEDFARVSFHFVRGKSLKKFASTLVQFLGEVLISW